MSFDPAILSPIAAVLAACLIGSASLSAAVYTHRSQDRLHRITAEVKKRETVYADFLMSASNLLLLAYTRDEIALSGDEQHLIGLINRMRLFAPLDVVDTAEDVFRTIVSISLKPSVELRQLAREALSGSLDPDPLLTFSLVCRKDLDGLQRTTAAKKAVLRKSALRTLCQPPLAKTTAIGVQYARQS